MFVILAVSAQMDRTPYAPSPELLVIPFAKEPSHYSRGCGVVFLWHT